jgi:hypothetical protein
MQEKEMSRQVALLSHNTPKDVDTNGIDRKLPE